MTCLQFARRSENPLHRSLNFRFWLDDIADAECWWYRKTHSTKWKKSNLQEIYLSWTHSKMQGAKPELSAAAVWEQSAVWTQIQDIAPWLWCWKYPCFNHNCHLHQSSFRAAPQQTDGRGVHERSRLLSYAAHFAIDFSHGFSVWLTRKKSLKL